MKFRPQRYTLDEAMKEVVELPPTRKALSKHLSTDYYQAPAEDITVEKYGSFDKRIGWDTYVVCVRGSAIGFTDGPLNE